MLNSHNKLYWSMLEGIMLGAATPIMLFPTVSMSLTILTVALIFSMWCAQHFYHSGNYQLTKTVLWTPILVLCIQTSLAVYVSVDHDLTIGKAAGLFIGLAWFKYFSTAIYSERMLHLSIVFVIIVGLLFLVIGFLTADWSVNKVQLLQPIVKRIPSIKNLLPSVQIEATQPNQIGGTILCFVFILFAVVLTFKQKAFVTICAALLSMIVTVMLILTQSRSAWLGFVFGCGVMCSSWIWYFGSRNPRFKLGSSITSIFLMVSGILGSLRIFVVLWADPTINSAIGPLGTLKFRQLLWPWAIEAANQFALTGTGLGTFRRVIHRLYPVAIPIDYDVAHAHNQFLQVQLDFGLFGLFAYISLIFLTVYLCWQSALNSVRLRWYAIGCACCIIAFHTFGITDAIALGAKTGIVWWMVIGIVQSIHRFAFITNNQTKKYV